MPIELRGDGENESGNDDGDVEREGASDILS